MAGGLAIDDLAPGRHWPPRTAPCRFLPPVGWALAFLLHGGIVLLAAWAMPQRQDPDPPIIEVVLPASLPQAEAEPSSESEPRAEPEPAPESVHDRAAPPPPSVAKPRSRRSAPAAETAAPPVAAPPVESPAVSASLRMPEPQPAAAVPAQPVTPYGPVLLDWLARHRDYPRVARLRRQEGSPQIALTLDRSGRLLDLKLTQSSGHDLLDDAALGMARRAAPFPPPQLPAGSDRAVFIVPVRFALER